MKKYILVISAGANEIKVLIYDKSFNIISRKHEKFTQFTPAAEKAGHFILQFTP